MAAEQGNVVSLDELRRKRQVSLMVNQIGDIALQGQSVAVEFEELVASNPTEAVSRLAEFIERMRAAAHAPGLSTEGIESLSGGPNFYNTAAVTNILAAHYEYLGRDEKEKVVHAQLGYLNYINTRYSQQHVRRINDPRLIGDITINVPCHWPGLDYELDFFDTKPDINAYNAFAQDCPSLGLLGFAAILKEAGASLPIKHSLETKSPELFDGVLDFSAARAYFIGWVRSLKNNTDYIKEVEKAIVEGFCPEYHPTILTKVVKAEWLYLSEYTDNPSEQFPQRQLAVVNGHLIELPPESTA